MSSLIKNGKHTVQTKPKLAIKPTNKEQTPLEHRNWFIHTQYVRGDFTLCRLLTDQELKRSNGRNEFANFINGLMFRDEGNIQEALDTFQKCYKINSTNTDTIKLIGECLYILGRYRISLEAYLESETQSKKPDWEVYYNIGRCLVKLGDNERAIEYVKRGVYLAPQQKPALLLSKLLSDSGNIDSAAAVCTNALQHFPESTEILTELGILQIRRGHSEMAFERLGSALALKSHNFKALLAIGCIAQNHGDFDVALSKYRLAAQLCSDSPALWNNIGLCFYIKQKYVGAVSCLNRARWLSPLCWRACYNLAIVYGVATQQPASAFQQLSIALALRPDHAPSFVLLGVILKQLGDMGNMLRALEKAYELDSRDPIVLVNYGLCLCENGYFDKASEISKQLNDIISNTSEEQTIDSELLKSADRINNFITVEEPVTESNENVDINEPVQLQPDEV